MNDFSLVRAFGPPLLTGVMRSEPEDFRVEELPAFEPSGEGEHLLLEVEKRGMNTAFVARHLAQWAGVPEHAVGYAGLKDRHALTRQRFSVHLPKRVAPELSGLELDGMQVLSSTWHARKLPRGALAGNRFVLTLREVEGDRSALQARVERILATGLPNFFGEQRFGRGGGNIEAARAMFAGRRVRRDQRSILLSAARSAVFNAVLARRVLEGDWATGGEGEVWMLDGSRSVFGPEPLDEELRARAASLDIHPTGPLWGRGELRSEDAVRALEEAVAAGFSDLLEGLEAAGLKQERRALRIRVPSIRLEWLTGRVLRLGFDLPPGAYATGVLHELGDVRGAASGAGGEAREGDGQRHDRGDGRS
ncbi:tRNA pseudouridine(13) synthase TruD [Alkalisalibacterium limincola]|nr:tRNA pseudouridine(13) synthase TruD [Alkalisalibacterium limincola]